MVWDECARQVVRDVATGKINRFRASVMLGVVERTVLRKVKAYRERGEASFEHGNKGKAPANKVDLETIMKFIVKKDLGGCNFSELCRLVEEYQHLSVSTSCLRKRLFAEGMLSVKCKRKTRKKMKRFLRELQERQEALTREKLQVLSALESEDVTGGGSSQAEVQAFRRAPGDGRLQPCVDQGPWQMQPACLRRRRVGVHPGPVA